MTDFESPNIDLSPEQKAVHQPDMMTEAVTMQASNSVLEAATHFEQATVKPLIGGMMVAAAGVVMKDVFVAGGGAFIAAGSMGANVAAGSIANRARIRSRIR